MDNLRDIVISNINITKSNLRGVKIMKILWIQFLQTKWCLYDRYPILFWAVTVWIGVLNELWKEMKNWFFFEDHSPCDGWFSSEEYPRLTSGKVKYDKEK